MRMSLLLYFRCMYIYTQIIIIIIMHLHNVPGSVGPVRESRTRAEREESPPCRQMSTALLSSVFDSGENAAVEGERGIFSLLFFRSTGIVL